VNDGYRGLRRDPLDPAPQVAVEHQVADHQHPAPSKPTANRVENALRVLEHAFNVKLARSALEIPLSRARERDGVREGSRRYATDVRLSGWRVSP